ncbi:MAG: HAD-IA family hydrolase [Anaerolineae bacterium]|nr:HAD-IA family hydrolase [Anaerolineae bacterium]
MAFSAFLFDMDGVIVDTQEAVTAFWEKLASAHTVTLTQADYADHIHGCLANHTLDALFSFLSPEQRKDVLSDMVAYETDFTYRAIPGVLPFIEKLGHCGVPMALVTAGARWKVDTVIGQLGLETAFDVQITFESIKQGKPHPECYLLAAEALGQAPESCIVFEDSVAGTQSGVASGAFCVGVRPAEIAQALIDVGAKTVIPDFTRVRIEENGDNLDLWLDEETCVPIGQSGQPAS